MVSAQAMNILFVGLQSCGGTVTTMLLGQHPAAVVIPDTCNPDKTGRGVRPGPLPKLDKLAVKVTVHGREDLDTYIKDAQETTNADRTILVLRNPYCNYLSLRNKKYGVHLDEKFAQLNRVVAGWKGEVVFYEDLAFHPRRLLEQFKDWPLTLTHFRLRRTAASIGSIARQELTWCKENGKSWGFGNASLGEIKHERMFREINPLDKSHVDLFFPELVRYYFEHRPEYAAFSPELTSY
jgi:hypothetical protein